MRPETLDIRGWPTPMFSIEQTLDRIVDVLRACDRRDSREVMTLLSEIPSPPDVIAFVEVAAISGVDLLAELTRVLSREDQKLAEPVFAFLQVGPRPAAPEDVD